MSKKQNISFYKKYNLSWVLGITVLTFVLAIIFNIITEGLVENLDVLLSFVILAIIIFIGVFFDTIGIAITSSNEIPFHSMAANKVEEAKYAIKLARNADMVSNFCNDVIGDISGIVSGAVGTNIIYKLVQIYDIKDGIILSIIITSLVAAITVGGKAIGKFIAIMYSNDITLKAAATLNFFKNKFGIELFSSKKRKSR